MLAHRLQVLLFGVADVTSDFLVHSKNQFLRKGHGSDPVWALKSKHIDVWKVEEYIELSLAITAISV